MKKSPNLFDAGLFIGALLQDDPRHAEARLLVEAARRGDLSVCTTTSILSEVYAALTWIHAQPTHSSSDAAKAIRLLIKPPSAIIVIRDGIEASFRMLTLTEKYTLTDRRVHNARHAATAIVNNITSVYTYDVEDWKVFEPEELTITGPSSILTKITPENQ